MKTKLIVCLAMVFLVLVAVACGSSSTKTASPYISQDRVIVPAVTKTASTYSFPLVGQSSINEKGPGAPQQDSSSVTYTNIAPGSLTSDRMVVRTGGLELVVQDIPAAIDEITRIAGDSGGYVVTSQKWKEGEKVFGTMSIRVPAGNYNGIILSLRALALEIVSETTSSQDVTEEYTDLGSKIKNLEATENQLLKIMQTAVKTEDVLSIQRELTTVRGEIEQAKGRMQYLERTSATSLINIKLNGAIINLKFSASKVLAPAGDDIRFTPEVSGGFAPYNYQWDFGDGNTSIDKTPVHAYQNPGIYSVVFKVTDDKGYTNTAAREAYINIEGSWNPGTVARSAWNGFKGFGRVLVNVIIWLGIFSPIWIVIGGIVGWIAYRKRRKSRKL
jgi:PKD repeat protein